MTETKTDVVLLIERVRRGTTNRDVLAVCDLLERALVVSTRRDVVTTKTDVVSTQCGGELCVRRRAAKSRSMKRWRAKPKKRINPLDAD